MANTQEYVICRVATVSGVDMKTAGETVLFSVPVGKTFIPFGVVVRNNTASLAGGTDYDFGASSGASTWRQSVDLSGLTVTTGYRWIYAADNATYTPIPAGGSFVVKVTTGATLAGTAIFDVFGYLI